MWSDKANAAFVDNTNNALIIPIGETALYLGNEKPYSVWETVKTNVPSQVTNGRTLVPIRQFAEALGAEVDWIDRYSTATISYTDIESEAMSSSLFDAINLNYYIGNNGDNPFVWYTDNVVNPFYNSRNLDLDAGVMGISKPWTVITDLWKGIYGDTNSSIIIQESLHKVLENLPEDTSNDLAWPGLVKDIKSYCIDIEKDSFELSQEFTKEFLANHETLKYINDGLLKVSQSRGVEIGSYLFDFSIFTVEQVAYWLSDYTVNMTYIDILESALEKQGILDYNMREAIEDLRIEYTEKYIGTLYDLPSEFIEQGFNVVSGGASGLGKTVWQGIFSATGVSKKAEALKTFYSIYCYNHALDEELTDVMHLTAGDVDIAYVNALINLQKAAKSTAINSIADMANWWIKDEVNQSADELKTSLNSWSYHNW